MNNLDNLRINLDVPYREKDEAKKLGAKWDPKIKKWYVPSNIRIDKFKKWIPED